jgi:ABC-2 type transport system permease protein
MKNVFLIIQREYLTRVKKKSFLIMTILGPVMLGLMYGGIIWATVSGTSQKKILINDASELFQGKFSKTESYLFTYSKENIEVLKKKLPNLNSDALIFIPKDVLDNPKNVKIYSEKGVSFELQSSIERVIEKEIETIKLTEAGITQSVLESSKVNIESETINLEKGGEKKNSAAAASIIGFLCAFLIYLSVFIYGAQVMRGITEEKTSRIVEIIISSVKPFQLMIGKIVGVGLVGLTQFGLWILLSAGIFSAGAKFMGPKLGESSAMISEAQLAKMPPEAQEAARAQLQQAGGMNPNAILVEIMGAMDTMPIATILISFIFYFLGGYLLYSALFGAVGSAVDSDTDAQQFMLPITIPIIAAFAISQIVIKDPNSSLAFWASMVPFTSPIIMMVRIPFGVPFWQIALSISLLIAGFIFTTWIAARIYRVGILMYGKKVTWKELGKWLFYKA